MDLPKRKPTRLKNYDYSSCGAYFITIFTHNKQNILCDIVGEGLCALPIIKLTPIGAAVNESIKYIIDNCDNISVDKFVIILFLYRIAKGLGEIPESLNYELQIPNYLLRAS